MRSERETSVLKWLEGTQQCNCDLDNWEPTKLTGHSHVCRIHKFFLEYSGWDRTGRTLPQSYYEWKEALDGQS